MWVEREGREGEERESQLVESAGWKRCRALRDSAGVCERARARLSVHVLQAKQSGEGGWESGRGGAR